jgi:hypothetical protein
MERKPKNKVEEDRVDFKGPGGAGASASHSPDRNDWGDDWVHKLIHLANGAGEGVFN